jgi:muramoyltetrapeptide carboxypeptidase
MIGFSDITVMHTHLLSNYNIASLHAPMAAAFNDGEHNNAYILSLRDALEGKKAKYICEPHKYNQDGKAKGLLIGGNLALLANVIGTASDFQTKNKIFFLEDIGEYLYNADRMLYQLQRGGKLKNIAGLVLGGFTDMKDTERPFGKTMEDILKDITRTLNCPVCYNFPVSHGKENVALKIGLKYELIVSPGKTHLEEL